VRHDPLRAVVAITLSQSTLMVAGAMADTAGFAAEYGMLAGTNLGATGLVLVLADLRRRYGVTRLLPDNGLADAEPVLSRHFLVLGWLFVGLPGGIVFFAEDLLFHALVQHSAWSAAAMIGASVLNAVAFHRVFLGVFSGQMRPGLHASGPVPKLLPDLLQVLTVVMLGLGFWPGLLLGDR
jgi:formate hydrogenlyase subunit 3/multisubunit Na+/H+ antiporter MnhD subunit